MAFHVFFINPVFRHSLNVPLATCAGRIKRCRLATFPNGGKADHGSPVILFYQQGGARKPKTAIYFEVDPFFCFLFVFFFVFSLNKIGVDKHAQVAGGRGQGT